MRVLLFVLLLLSAGSAWSRPLLVASIEPVALALRELYGEQVQVETLMLPQQTPHQVAFTPAQARQVQAADLLVWLGADAEPALAGLMRHRHGPALALAQVPGVVTLHADHHHHDGDEVHSLAADPHLWLSPENMRHLARALADGELAPPAPRRAAFEQALADTEAQLRQLLAPLQDMPWLSAHDPWRYFHRHFGLSEPLVINASGQSGASARRFARLADSMASLQVRCAIAEPEAGRALLARLCESPQCQLVALDPLARDQGYDGYSHFLRRIGAGFAQCLRLPASG